MKNLISLIMASIVFIAAAQADIKTDRQSVDTACAQEATTANCGTKQVGTGLLKCLNAYKKANSTFQYSAACNAAIEALHTDKKQNKPLK